MVSVDTNILVRFLTADHPDQFRRAEALLSHEDIFIAKTVVLETEWVLRSTYGYTPPEIEAGLRGLIALPRVTVEDADAVLQALDWFQAGLDFADALHLASAGQSSRFATFDRDLIRRAKSLADAPGVAAP